MGIRVGALYCFVIAGAFCQLAPDYSHFEVAAVRPSPPAANLPPGAVPAPILRGGPGSTDPERINYSNVSLGPLILETAETLPRPRGPLKTGHWPLSPGHFDSI